MTESEFQIAKIRALLRAYIKLVQLRAEPGDKHYNLSKAEEFIKKQLKEALK